MGFISIVCPIKKRSERASFQKAMIQIFCKHPKGNFAFIWFGWTSLKSAILANKSSFGGQEYFSSAFCLCVYSQLNRNHSIRFYISNFVYILYTSKSNLKSWLQKSSSKWQTYLDFLDLFWFEYYMECLMEIFYIQLVGSIKWCGKKYEKNFAFFLGLREEKKKIIMIMINIGPCS